MRVGYDYTALIGKTLRPSPPWAGCPPQDQIAQGPMHPGLGTPRKTTQFFWAVVPGPHCPLCEGNTIFPKGNKCEVTKSAIPFKTVGLN